MLDAEQKPVEALGTQAEESSRPDLQKALQPHQQQTQKQVERIQQCFDLLDEEAEETECKGIAGIMSGRPGLSGAASTPLKICEGFSP